MNFCFSSNSAFKSHVLLLQHNKKQRKYMDAGPYLNTVTIHILTALQV